MNARSHPLPGTGSDKAFSELTPTESARYTKELLDSLRGIAVRQEQLVLASLLEAAAREAKRLIALQPG